MYTKTIQPSDRIHAAQRSRVIERSPIFYGWIIAAVGTLGMIMTSPGQTYSVSIFLEYFIADLGISRSVVSSLYTAGTLIGSFALPLIGRQIDGRGPRFMVVLISLLFGLACLYMGLVANGVMLLLGFVAIRMFGQGALGLISVYVINQWWVRRRGSVMGISNLVTSLLGLGLFPSLIYWLINSFGWRMAYPILGVMVLALMLPLGHLFFRQAPEQFGLKPDGGKRPQSTGTDLPLPVDLPEEEWTAAEAMRTPAFWIVVTGLASVSMLSTGLMFHMVSIFRDNGLSDAVAAQAFVPVAMTTALITLGGGILVDRIPARFVLIAGLICQILSLVMAYRLTGIGVALFYGVLLGATNGLVRSVSSVIWANYFGRRHLGAITGVTSTILVAGSALGPMPMGIARDLLGSYNMALNILAVIPLILAVAALFVKKPEKAGQNG
jgi:MFS family permease